ncbi:gamma-aminobutyric acid receptor subunit alpha-6 isoform X1 [Procambarus clarkii]|uniref:gamma-aminobutyric acid receptor subunit alpha-6 isoform X1 n=2 Tax=Procambarus clarkii TaxID=6728 RepID=UPI001E670159|nr:gamma-aminobutyric acid receptor subunit alpha-6-like isoform X2 [Procambarus clarkii]
MVGSAYDGGLWWWWWWRWWCWAAVLTAALGRSEAFSSTYSVSGFSKNVTNLLDSLLADYDRMIRPGHGGPPTTIMVNMNVRSMGPFSEKQESYAMQLYLRQKWFDPRLRFNKTDLGKSVFSMNWMFAAKLWKPDTFFINGKNSYVHKITAPNTFIRLQFDGQITWSLRLTVRASCKMHLRKFPLDTQICPLSLASYGYNAEDMVYRWSPEKVTVDPDVSIAQYELFNITTNFTNVVVRRKETISTLSVKFHLKRLTGFFLLQVYVPCILIVCCSWVAFWITKKDVPGRVCLGTTTVLSLTKMGIGGRASMPQVSYLTSLDYFNFLCFAYVFGAIVEFAMINFFERMAKRRRIQVEDAKKAFDERTEAEIAIMEFNMAAEKDATMLVTTTVRDEGGVDIGASLRDTLKVPLSVVPLSVQPIEEEVQVVDTQSPLKEALKLPLAVVPVSLQAIKKEEQEGLRARIITKSPELRESDVDSGGNGSGIDTSVVSGEMDPILAKRDTHLSGSDSGSATSRGSIFKFKKESSEQKTQDSESDLTVIKVDIQSEDESPSPPPPFTVWQILTKKRKLMSEMSPGNTVPSEEDLLDRFSIIDLYARRFFPSTFFILFTIYWVLFNYYITDEFPEEDRLPSDGLVVV